MQSRFDHWDPHILDVNLLAHSCGPEAVPCKQLIVIASAQPLYRCRKPKNRWAHALFLSIIRQIKDWIYLCSALTAAPFCYRRMLSWASPARLQYAWPPWHSKAETMMGMHTSAMCLPCCSALVTHSAIRPLHSELGKTPLRLCLDRDNAALSQCVYEVVYILHAVRCRQAYPQPAWSWQVSGFPHSNVCLQWEEGCPVHWISPAKWFVSIQREQPKCRKVKPSCSRCAEAHTRVAALLPSLTCTTACTSISCPRGIMTQGVLDITLTCLEPQ